MLLSLIGVTLTILILYEMFKLEKRKKYLPAKIKRCLETGEFFIKLLDRNVRVHNLEDEEDSVVVQSRTDFIGSSPKRYVSTCYFKPKTIPAWYTESLLIRIGSTKRIYDEKVWYKQKLQPYYWSESMTTEVNFPPTKSHMSQVAIPVTEMESHYISLEPQQIAIEAS